ncbi:MAG: hypothetical protein ACLFOZ_18545 [Cyclobacteriaceae bacterium]
MQVVGGKVSFTDTSSGVLSGKDRRSSSVSVADYNNDGLPVLYLCNLNEDVLLQNQGDGSFMDVTL